MNASSFCCDPTMLASPISQTAFSCASSSAQARIWKLTNVQETVSGHLLSALFTRYDGTMFARMYAPLLVPKRIRIVAAGNMHHTSVDFPNDGTSPVAEIALEGGETSERGGNEVCDPQNLERLGYRVAAMCAGIMLGAYVWAIPPSYATDALKTCACLLKECRLELARCIGDPACAANVACLQTCNNRPDETECQIGCGDLFENAVVDQFNDCAVSRKKCVPQKGDKGDFPVPPPVALVKKFNVSDFNGSWYISSGLNPTFDTFDCQLHKFSVSSNNLTGKLSWRIKTPDGGFFTRSAVQHFKQNQSQPGILLNHDNEFLHYEDDWYILSAKTEQRPDDYIFVYYRGRNDAWDGYGGAVVYTRSKTLPASIIPELTAAAQRVGLDFNKFINTDNKCGPEPPLIARLEQKIEMGERLIAQEVKQVEEEVERDELTLLDKLKNAFLALVRREDSFLKELGDEEKALLQDLQMEASAVEKLFGKALPIRKFR